MDNRNYKRESSFAGFLDGYSAGNLNSMENKVEEFSSLNVLMDQLKSEINPGNVFIENASKILKSNSSNETLKLKEFGQLMNVYLDQNNNYQGQNKEIVNKYLEQIIYEYLRSVKTTGDSVLMEIGLNVAKKGLK